MKLVGVGGKRNKQTHLAKSEKQGDDGKAEVSAQRILPRCGAHLGQHTGTQSTRRKTILEEKWGWPTSPCSCQDDKSSTTPQWGNVSSKFAPWTELYQNSKASSRRFCQSHMTEWTGYVLLFFEEPKGYILLELEVTPISVSKTRKKRFLESPWYKQ